MGAAGSLYQNTGFWPLIGESPNNLDFGSRVEGRKARCWEDCESDGDQSIGSPYVVCSSLGMGANEVSRGDKSTFGNADTREPLLSLSCKWFEDGEVVEFG
jgi:hypothetical protein